MLIGVLLTFSNSPLYDTYRDLDRSPIWGMNALDDQHLGGLIMWVPGGMFFLFPLLGVLFRIMNQAQDPVPPRNRPSRIAMEDHCSIPLQ